MRNRDNNYIKLKVIYESLIKKREKIINSHESIIA
jgi:hypothetical protein